MTNLKFAERQSGVTVSYLMPKRIVCEKNTLRSALLLTERPRQAVLNDDETAVIKKGGYVIFDFGAEISGGADIVIKRTARGAYMRIVFGESVSEAMSETGVKNATNDHAIRDTLVKVTSWQHFKTWSTGFRFLKLEAVNEDIHISGVQAAFEYRDLEYKGSFECDDALINKVWQTGAYTVHLNMQEYLWDGIKRDRLVWVGDMHPEISVILAVFGDVSVVRDSLDLIRDNTPGNGWMNGYASYNMWWLAIHCDWYMATGDFEYLKEQRNYIFEMLNHVLDCINSDGTHNIERRFVEWSSKDTKEENAGMQAMLVRGLEYGARLCGILNNEALRASCLNAVKRLRTQHYEYAGNKQIAAMVSLTDMDDSKKISDTILKKNGAEGISTFWGYYTLLALAKTGDCKAALDIIRNYWGLMLKFGATTFWEDFDVSWTQNAAPIDEPVPEGMNDLHGDFGKYCYKQFRHSLCHGWAGGPTAFLSRCVLGIECIEPGFKTVRINPQLGGLQWVRGKYPTPMGCIEVYHEQSGGGVISEISAPKGIKIIKD